MIPTTHTEGFVPLKVQRTNPTKALRSVVRVSRTSHTQIHVRVSQDIAKDLGWATDGMIEVAVLVGTGDKAGRVLFIPAEKAPDGAHRVNVQRRRGSSRTISIGRIALGVREPDEAFTAPHSLAHGGIEVDLSSILEG